MKNRTKILFALSTVALLALPVALNAQELREDRQARGQERFASVDTNTDGLVSLDEFLAAHDDRVASLDADGDGLFTAEELSAFAGPGGHSPPVRAIERRMERADSDGDGALSHDEIESAHALRFEAADADADGFLSFDEAREARPGHGHRVHAGREGMREQIQGLDTNGDREISRDEAALSDIPFDDMDRNGDGVLNREDRPERGERGNRHDSQSAGE
jgi:Ca2+-binding EF-hand superfamily protein